MKLSKLKLNKANPRLIKDDKFHKLVKSIKEFPKMLELRPIVIDNDYTILGGNMRYKALLELGYKDIPDSWVKRADELTDAEKQRFIIEDNVGFGEWDFTDLKENWDSDLLEDWGVDFPGFADISIGTDGFTLPEGDREPFQQMTFTFSDEQANYIKEKVSEIKKTEDYKYCETFGNENSNGNALYLIVSQWAEQRK